MKERDFNECDESSEMGSGVVAVLDALAMANFGCFLVLRKLLFVSFCVVVWVLFSVFSIFCITSLVSATPRNHPNFDELVILSSYSDSHE